jgi:hypothetical protein
MPERIDFGEISDRDLLIITVKTTNEICTQLTILNGTVRSNEKRITALETADKIRQKLNNGYHPVLVNKNIIVAVISSLFAVGIVIGGIFYGFGKLAGWW